jgi:hypothetical protein
MCGNFSLAAHGSDTGRDVADPARRFIAAVTLKIPSVTRFVADPQHTGMLDGTITFDGIGSNAPVVSGWFKLFAPSSDLDLKLMIYRMTFGGDAGVYTLHGEKHVRRGSILRAWRDTTTLRCRVHRGADDTGPVCAAGTLHITLPGFARQLLSFRTLHGGTLRTRARALGGFFGFFARELRQSYL